jgi:hypothetical protein
MRPDTSMSTGGFGGPCGNDNLVLKSLRKLRKSAGAECLSQTIFEGGDREEQERRLLISQVEKPSPL